MQHSSATSGIGVIWGIEHQYSPVDFTEEGPHSTQMDVVGLGIFAWPSLWLY